MRSYRVVRAGLLICIFICSARLTSATPIVDQSFSVIPPSLSVGLSLSGDTAAAQSFTVGIAGLLTGADLMVFDASPSFGLGAPPASDISVQIRTLLAGLPTETVLTSGAIPASLLSTDPNNQFTHVNFTFGIAVVPGQIFALTIAGTADGWFGQVGSPATYAGGQAFERAHGGSPWQPFTLVDPGGREGDFLFRTYVDPTAVPEPSTLVLLGSVGALLWAKHARQKD